MNNTAKADWLRSEIEKLEGMKINDFGFIEVQLNGITHKVKAESDRHIFYNTALTTLITRYKEELKVLENVEQYKCKSYFDENNTLQDCTCKKCS